MTVFELLGINSGDAIVVDNPWSDNGEREVIPLALSRNGISIRAIDTRYGDICYVDSDWSIAMSDGSIMFLEDFPYIKQKLDEWEEKKDKQRAALKRAKEEVRQEELNREFATLEEVLGTINVTDLKVAITGTLPLPRSTVKAMLESNGATVMGSVGKQTAFLFMGDTGKYEITSKMKKAHDLGVKIITL